MSKLFYVGGIVAAGIMLQGCGTVVRGTSEDVVINVEPAHAKVTSTTAHTCTGPCVIKVSRKQEMTLTASAPGYQTEVLNVGTRVSGKGAAGMAGNVLIGGFVGMGVDAASGATLDHYPNPVYFSLERGKGKKTITAEEASKPNS
ncbi:translation initiation factor 2 [Flexibacterium corallicola]|uniref:translation initiation factor 2 n=1 Tax=Flexibacterium corallicola TaxID=3037259 RepID=UPI00286EDB5B|nr:translation initiation factor 2 [Pseudovibrio sp. M1P-2-3]